ncbi:hypothetical protein GPN2_10061 [Streptomyces murinus]
MPCCPRSPSAAPAWPCGWYGPGPSPSPNWWRPARSRPAATGSSPPCWPPGCPSWSAAAPAAARRRSSAPCWAWSAPASASCSPRTPPSSDPTIRMSSGSRPGPRTRRARAWSPFRTWCARPCGCDRTGWSSERCADPRSSICSPRSTRVMRAAVARSTPTPPGTSRPAWRRWPRPRASTAPRCTASWRPPCPWCSTWCGTAPAGAGSRRCMSWSGTPRAWCGRCPRCGGGSGRSCGRRGGGGWPDCWVGRVGSRTGAVVAQGARSGVDGVMGPRAAGPGMAAMTGSGMAAVAGSEVPKVMGEMSMGAALICLAALGWLLCERHHGVRRARLLLAGGGGPGAGPSLQDQLGSALRRLRDRWGVEWWALVAGLLLALLGGSVIPVVAGAAGVPVLRRVRLAGEAGRARERRVDQVIALCGMFAGEVRAGRQPGEALLRAARDSGGLGEALAAVVAAARFGGDVPGALAAAARQPGAEDCSDWPRAGGWPSTRARASRPASTGWTAPCAPNGTNAPTCAPNWPVRGPPPSCSPPSPPSASSSARPWAPPRCGSSCTAAPASAAC